MNTQTINHSQAKLANAIKATFPVRRMDFVFKDTPRYWMGNSAGLTHFFTALSCLFPDGEKFFVDSVRAIRNDPKLADMAMQKEISAFIGQEAMHSKEHLAFNHSAEKYGHDVQRLERATGKVIKTAEKFVMAVFKPLGMTKEMIGLTGTCALEHFTASIASELLKNTEMQALIQDETMYRLWMWHAVEENEHKSVAFDVYTTMYGRGPKAYFMRSSAMAIAMVVLLFTQGYFTASLLKEDHKLNVKETTKIVKFLFGRKGFITNQMPELLAFFRPNFHPTDFDTVELLNTWKQKLGFVAH